MNFIKLSIVFAAIVSISACSKAPSESDAKQAVVAMLGNCSHLSLDHFEKINGMAIGERGYKVDVSYSVKVTALPESKKMVEEISAKLAEIDSRLEKAIAERDVVEAEAKNCDSSSTCPNGKSLEIMSRQTPLRHAVDILNKEKMALLENIANPLRDKFAKECPNVNPFLYAQLYDGVDAAQYAKDFTKDFSGTINMLKTDNGWMPVK